MSQDTIRLSKKVAADGSRAGLGAIDTWYHLDCFKNNKAELEFNFKTEE